jgi:preprotein translocase subunit SecD
MLDFPRWKVVSIWAVLLALMALAIPSLLPERVTDSWGAFPHKRINLGLDLAGGSYLLLEADTGDFVTSRVEALRDQIAAELRRGPARIETGDVSTQGGRVAFLLRDPTQVDAARERIVPLLGGGAGLTGQRVWDLQVVDQQRFVITPTSAGIASGLDEAMKSAIEVVRRRIDALGTREPTIIRQGASRIVVQVPGFKDPQALKTLLGKTAKLEFKMVDEAADPQAVARGITPIGDQLLPLAPPANAPKGTPAQMLAVHREVIVSGDQLVKSSQGFKPDTNEPIVDFTFDSLGGRNFARVTQENAGKRFAIILDNQIISAPAIRDPILGGSGYIEGSFTVESANELAIELRSGALQVPLKVVEERSVGPDLGRDSIHAGIVASVIAAVAVIAFMLVTYGRFGFYADLAVVINIFVILGVLALLNGTLTLPGIAGFVLTIGTAVDANVLINERIREERRRGRGVVQAVELGYKEASRTIFEANVTHAISGVIMFLLGSGPVKGFAVVLLIGIATSVFTAVLFTRMLVAQYIRRNRPTTITI